MQIQSGYAAKQNLCTECVSTQNLFFILNAQIICDQISEKGSYSLSNCMHLTVCCVTCEYGTNLKFGHLTLLTWFYFWEQFYLNRLNTLWGKLRKAIRPLFADLVTFHSSISNYYRMLTAVHLFLHMTRQSCLLLLDFNLLYILHVG